VTAAAASARGYTLVEVLVVCAIVGIVVATAALTWRGQSAARLEDEAGRLASRIELALAQHQVAARRLAISIQADRYAFWERNAAGQWIESRDDAEPRGTALPEGLTVESVSLDGMRVAPGERMRLSSVDPHMLRIVLVARDARAVVATGEYAGRIRVALETVQP
jgi:general secretion pathway protein H